MTVRSLHVVIEDNSGSGSPKGAIMERESSLEERQRKDAEKAAAIKERQVRLGHIPAPTEEVSEEESEEEPKPKPKSRAKK